jgi:FG-GAP-like repeat
MRVRLLAVSMLFVCSWPPASTFAQPYALAYRANAGGQLYRINLATGTAQPIGGASSADISALAMHPHTGVLYAVSIDATTTSDVLLVVDPTTGLTRGVASLRPALITLTEDEGLTFDAAGNLFLSVEETAGPIPPTVMQVNPENGFAMPLGFGDPPVTGMTWRNGIIYGLTGHGTNRLVAVHPVNGRQRDIGSLGVQVNHGGLDFDRDGGLWGINDAGVIFRINPQTGAASIASNTLAGFESLHVIKPVPVITAPGAGGGPHVVGRVDTNGDGVPDTLTANFFAYDPGFAGGVRVARCDVDADGVPDLITAPGAGGASFVRVFSGATGAAILGFLAYDGPFFGGVHVACGDVNGDGKADIITGPGAGNGPLVKVFNGATGTLLPGPAASFFAYTPSFTGGVRVAAGDVNGDSIADIITAPGPGGGPHVRVFDGAAGFNLLNLFPYDLAFTGGLFVAAGDINGDGRADVITAPGAGGGPHIKVFDRMGALLQSFLAYDAAFAGGVTVAAGDVNGDGRMDIITGPASAAAPNVRAFDATTALLVASFFAYDPSFTGGVWVAGGVGF